MISFTYESFEEALIGKRSTPNKIGYNLKSPVLESLGLK